MDRFAERLKDYLDDLARLRQLGASEDSIRDAFLRFLRSAFPRLEYAEPILLERHIPGLKVRGGFADALYGDLIFEFKKRLDDHSRAEGKDELKRYLGNQKHPERFFGIFTDGEQLEVYAVRNQDLAKVDELCLVLPDASHAKLWLDCYLFHEKNLEPTAADVALRFGEHSPTFWHSMRVLQELWQQCGSEATVQTKVAEWQSLLSIVYGSPIGDETLFLRHTYLALFARVLAFVALQHRAPTTEELAGIVTGSTFERLGFENFVEDDFFTWVNASPAFEMARGMLHAVATRLTAAYDLDAIREDLLKELYQELVDPQTRHDLGEFYTPDWLAELTLRNAGFPQAEATGAAVPSLLDPACGSGTFLFTAVRLLREAGYKGKALVDFCSQHLAGIDVHPLAITIAKTNVLLALGGDVKGHPRHLTLPIYMADTLSSLQPALQENVVRIPVDVDTIAKRAAKSKPRGLPPVFELPEALAEQPELLYDTLNALLEFADPSSNDADAIEGFNRRLEDMGIANGKSYLWRRNLALMRWLLTPPATDSVWRFVLRNAYQPELLARRKFAFVVGNPPWLSYRYIKRPDYQERVRTLVFQYQLLSKREAHLFTQMELATLFFAFCVDRYMADDGIIAFVMPRSVLTGAKQHAAFRKDYLPEASLLMDCEQVSPLFKVPSCVIIDPRRRTRQPRIRMFSLRGRLMSRNASLTDAMKHLVITETWYTAPLAERGSRYWAEVTQGGTLVPRCFWFVRPPETARVIDQRRPQLETDPATERKAKAPWKGIRLSGNVEAEFLFATLLSEGMVPFGWRQLSLVVLPLEEEKSTGLRMLNAGAAIRAGKSALADWLRKVEAKWTKHAKKSKRVGSPYERLDFSRCLTNQSPTGVSKIIYNATGTYLCSCVMDLNNMQNWKIHGLSVRGFLAQHKNYWLDVEDPDEAHYLCAVLNAPLVDKAIKPHQPRGLGGERGIERLPFEVLPIPRFSSSDKRHRELARISQRCHEKVRVVVANADERWLKAPIGRVRTEIRRELLKKDLTEIDNLVAEIL